MIKIGDKVKLKKELRQLNWYHDKYMIVKRISFDAFGTEVIVEDSYGIDIDNCIYISNLYNVNKEIRLKKLNSL